MQWLWTWSGRSFGYRAGNNLWTHDGRNEGRFNNDLIYGRDGKYLGEIRGSNRLITHKSKKTRRKSSFSPLAKRVGHVQRVNYVGNVMLAGYEDFPRPEEL